MLKAIAITDNFNFTKEIMRTINIKKLNIQLVDVAESQDEALTLLDNLPIDLLFFDKKISKSYKRSFIHKYKDILIIPKYASLLPHISTQNLADIETIRHNNDVENRKQRIINELEYIGYDFKYKGTHYLVDTILEMYLLVDNVTDNLQSDIYPIVAKKYNKTVYNIKSSIGKATDAMSLTSDLKKLATYFHFSDDTKPTPKQVVFAVLNKIQRYN